MADTPMQNPQDTVQKPAQASIPPEHHGILDQTLDEILHTNPQAQSIVMKGMNLTPEQFQQMLQKADSNQLMHTKVRDLFSNGTITQAVQQYKGAQAAQSNPMPVVPDDQIEITAEQAAQLQQQAQNGMTVQPAPQNQSITQKIKRLFGL